MTAPEPEEEFTLDFPEEVLALIPDPIHGVAVIDVRQLVAYLDDGADLDTAISDAGTDRGGEQPEQVLALLRQVRELNARPPGDPHREFHLVQALPWPSPLCPHCPKES